jgi:hypothetical protein
MKLQTVKHLTTLILVCFLSAIGWSQDLAKERVIGQLEVVATQRSDADWRHRSQQRPGIFVNFPASCTARHFNPPGRQRE